MYVLLAHNIYEIFNGAAEIIIRFLSL